MERTLQRITYWLCLLIWTFPCIVHADDTAEQIQEAFRKGLGEKTGSVSIETKNGITRLSANNETRDCTLCDTDTLLYEARLLGAHIRNARIGRSVPTVSFQHFPTDTTIHVDGIPVPSRIRAPQLEPGDHIVTMRRKQVTGILHLQLEDDKNITPNAAKLTFDHLHSRLLMLGIISAGTGIALGGTGIALLSIDNTCATVEVDANGVCTKLHDTRAPGAVLLAIGIPLLVAAISVFIFRSTAIKRARQRFFSNSARAKLHASM
ncbi:MAG: hypothetical protein JXX29_16025 [Deltaproteobacteria bacterium]|nr:hypothetical protein [Deltaproteobacteria bacterium]MBN2673190.1 hypothetical protein [Deltaproteobacteria bacterium]